MCNTNQCPRCLEFLSSRQRLDSHLKRKIPCENINDNSSLPKLANKIQLSTSKKFICQHCKKSFANKDTLSVHLKKRRCIVLKVQSIDCGNHYYNKEESPNVVQKGDSLCHKENLLEGSPESITKKEFIPPENQNSDLNLEDVVDQMIMMQKEIVELKQKPSTINQVLQVISIGSSDNYLDMLTEEYGNFSHALKFITDCALSSVSGDCKLIDKIYLNRDPTSITYIDKARTKIVFFDENQNKVIDPKGVQLGKRLANNLQNSLPF